MIGIKLTHEEFIEKLDLRFPNRNYEIIGKYINYKTRIIIKNKYGLCLISPGNLFFNTQPSINSAINKTEYFIKQSQEVHGNRYDYSKTIYGKNQKEKIVIICRKHGEFLQQPSNHLSNKGCKKCGEEKSGFSRQHFIINCNKSNQSILYVLQCWNNFEKFYKIGITSNSIKKRYYGKKMPYVFKIIYELKSNSENIWNLEKNIKKKYKEYKYVPKIDFGGKHECFNSLLLIEEIIGDINE